MTLLDVSSLIFDFWRNMQVTRGWLFFFQEPVALLTLEISRGQEKNVLFAFWDFSRTCPTDTSPWVTLSSSFLARSDFRVYVSQFDPQLLIFQFFFCVLEKLSLPCEFSDVRLCAFRFFTQNVSSYERFECKKNYSQICSRSFAESGRTSSYCHVFWCFWHTYICTSMCHHILRVNKLWQTEGNLLGQPKSCRYFSLQIKWMERWNFRWN